MPGIVFIDPNNPANKYYALRADDGNVPAGYVRTSNSDGSPDRDVQTFQPGVYSAGYPVYGDPANQGTVGAPGKIR